MNAWDIGDLRLLTATFKNLDGTPTDPATVTIKVRTPDGVLTEYVYGTDPEVTKDVVGVYYLSFVPTQSGYHGWSGHGTGAVQEGGAGGFMILRSV